MKWSQTHPNAWGNPGSYVAYGPMWAQVSMTPFSQYKGWLAEGGIRNALIVSGPAVKRPKGSINHGLMFVGDIMPTLLEAAGVAAAAKLKYGKKVKVWGVQAENAASYVASLKAGKAPAEGAALKKLYFSPDNCGYQARSIFSASCFVSGTSACLKAYCAA